MGRTSNSLQHELIKNVLPQIENNRTGTAYKKHIKNFAAWAKENGYRRPEQITKDVIQDYEKHLEDSPKQYSAATIHTYLAPVCKAAGVGMEEIRKPKRTAGRITRGRDCDATGAKIEKNQQGRRQEHLPKFARLTQMQKAVGVRRAELGKLTGADLIQHGDRWYVRVNRGKGGKQQMQYILPKDVLVVKEIFEGIGENQRVFSREEMSNKLNLHGMRAEHSRDCYAYYADLIKNHPGAADSLRSALISRWENGHRQLKNNNPSSWEAQRMRFIRDMDDRPYALRGENLRKAKALGRPEEYNRLALMCVSVFHLSHWRLDVTSVNYLV